MAWIYILIAGIFEVGFTVSLKLSDNFRKPGPIILIVIFSLISFYFLSKAMSNLPVGTTYAIWTGIGTIGITLIGVFFWQETMTLMRLGLLLLLIGTIAGLKMTAH